MAPPELLSDVRKITLHVPSLQEVVTVLLDGLRKNFRDVSVQVVDCPDLTKEPFTLSAAGLCGSPRLADVGGPPYLIPTPRREKIFNLLKIARSVELPHSAFLIGAGAGPCHVVGTNCELMCNTMVHDGDTANVTNNTYIAKLHPQDGSYRCDKIASTDFCLMGNFFISEGKPGKVIEVKATNRIGPANFVSHMRSVLACHYGNDPVAIGGTFLIKKGKAKLHIMPDFSDKPLNSDEDVDQWLKYFDMHAPLVCVGELVSYDPGFDLRMEHFHCFSHHGQGGHYHYDTTPEEVEYVGYFNVAEYVYRIDAPPDTHNIGQD